MFASRQPVTPRAAAGPAGRRDSPPAAARSSPTALLQRQVGNRAFRLAAHGGAPRVQRACACGGTCAHCKQEDGTVQTKLTVGAPGDAYEQEADRVAARVTGGSEAAPPAIRRLSDGAPAAGRSDVSLPMGEGRPLSPATRDFMEPRIGADFSGVRLHAGPRAEAASDRLQARAFTYGSDVWLGRGASEGDRRLMAHELTHVVQQGSAGPRVQRDPPPPPPPAAPQQCPDGVKTLPVDMVSLRGNSRNPLADLAFANAVFRPCCVQFTLGTGLTVAPALSDTWLGGDTELSRDTSPSSVHAEEAALFDGAAARFRLTSRLRAYYVGSLNPGARATSRPAVWATGAAAPYEGTTVVTSTATDRSLAHELGHVLLNATGAVHTTHPGGTDNLMEPSNTSTGERLEPSQCATIFANA